LDLKNILSSTETIILRTAFKSIFNYLKATDGNVVHRKFLRESGKIKLIDADAAGISCKIWRRTAKFVEDYT
jgi:hypothetical protein